MSLVAAQSVHPWAWRPHPEVWVLVVSVVAMGVYVTRVIGPKAVPGGVAPVSAFQKRAFVAGVVLLEVAADWPMHDIGENYLYSVHMVQHFLLTLVIPPLFLLATPTWLALLVVGDGWFGGKALRWLARPIQAGVIYNAVTVFVHWPTIVNLSVRVGLLHFGLHLGVFAVALLMWMPVCGPIPTLRISLPAQMVYLFLMSIVPTIPAAWLTFATGVVYKAYDTPYRLGGISALSDQQAAGLIMKLGAGSYLWILIGILFFKWVGRRDGPVTRGRLVTKDELLTWEDVSATFDALGPPPSDDDVRTPAAPHDALP
jgi:putative membrane protein